MEILLSLSISILNHLSLLLMDIKPSSKNRSAQDQFIELMCGLEERYGKEEIERLKGYANAAQSSEQLEFELTTSYRSSYGD